ANKKVPFSLTGSAPCVHELDASSDVRRPNELKCNVVEQDDRQVNVPFKRTCVRSLDLFPSLDQQPSTILRVYPVDPSLCDSNGVSLVGPSTGRAASERVALNTQFLPQPVNSVNVNLSSTPIDDHSDHDHNDVHVADECIPPPDRGFRCPAVSSDTRYAPAVNTDTSWQRSRRAPTVNMATSRQQPPGSGPPSDYRYLGACSYSCQNCGALFWGEEHLKSVPRAREKFQDTHVPNFKVRLYNVVGAREYELSTRDMLGVIVYETGPETDMDYDIVLEGRSGYLQLVNKLHPYYTSLQFPIMFIYGQDGYSKDLKMIDPNRSSSDQKRLTMLAFYSYQLHDRANYYNYLSRTDRLFQQYVVIAFCAIEQNRMDYVCEHQNDIRNEYPSGIYDAIKRGDSDGFDCRLRLILPQSFTVP
ncbi:hypothetical protein Tco_1249201, partial [Tanacetum coccineum]